MLPIIDHLIFAAPTLESGMDAIEKKLGIRPVIGGQHKGRGTHNALLTFGDIYFEVIAPDPAQPDVSKPLWMKIDQVTQPKLWTWAAVKSDLLELEKIANQNQIPLGKIENGTRTKTDGNILKWQLTEPILENENGIMPFFLNWGETIHPSKTLPQAGEILSFKAIHPNPEFIRNQLEKLNINLLVEKGNDLHLEATIRTLRGDIIQLS
ncbi:MAG: VOC family protein [Saprospiraceae bacterium]